MTITKAWVLCIGCLAASAAPSACSSSSGGTSENGDAGGGGDATSSSSSSGSGSGSSSGVAGSSSGSGSSSGATGSSSGSGSSSGTGSSSGGGTDSGIPSSESDWLDPMNAARAALNVGEVPLQWDPIAAAVAQNWASQCGFMHNANASMQYDAMGGMNGLGENIAAAAPSQTVAAAVASWVAEKQYYDHTTNSCASGQSCGHYTQIVWAKTTAAGCAKVSCTMNSPFGGSGTWDFSVCDFNPPGNVVGQSPY